MERMTKEQREARHQLDLIRVPRIEKLMQEQGRRPVDLARLIGLSERGSYLSGVKNNQTVISDARIAQIANWLDTTVEYLNGETENPNSPTASQAATTCLTVDEQYLLETYRMCHTYEDHRRLLDVCDQLRAENALGAATTA